MSNLSACTNVFFDSYPSWALTDWKMMMMMMMSRKEEQIKATFLRMHGTDWPVGRSVVSGQHHPSTSCKNAILVLVCNKKKTGLTG